MPRFYKQNLLSDEKLLESPLDTPELPPAHIEDNEDDDDKDDPVRTLLTWTAPSRPFRKKDRSYYTTVAILITLVSLIAFLSGEKLLIGALIALGFLVYVLNFIPPEEVEYKISTQGATIGDHFYHWQELDSFWLTQKEGHQILNIQTRLRFPAILMMVLGSSADLEKIKRTCAKYLPFHEIAPKSLMDKWSESLVKHFPLENPHR